MFSPFPTDLKSIRNRLSAIDPVRYGRSRNYIDGSVTKLSPYISRGVLSTRQILEHVLNRGYSPKSIEKFIQELAWRDYWQQIWISKGDLINKDLRHPQKLVSNRGVPSAISAGQTGIVAIDQAIMELKEYGYMHNHVRMYTASLACNLGHSHWHQPARWMYYHLLDADWASNALSWQWVAGSNSNKKYIANQQNINKYCYTNQQGTFLDLSYDQLNQLEQPEVLREYETPQLETNLPVTSMPKIDADIPTAIYTIYNLDPCWHGSENMNRILLLEPSHFSEYPVSDKLIDFVHKIAVNIPSCQIYVGEFLDLHKLLQGSTIYYKEHPLSRHFIGIEESRDWMFDVQGYFRSFFTFWKKAIKTNPF